MTDLRGLLLLIGVSLGVGLICVCHQLPQSSVPLANDQQLTNISHNDELILATHRLPLKQVSSIRDVWGTPLKVFVRDECRLVVTAGPDCEFGTPDDEQFSSPHPEY